MKLRKIKDLLQLETVVEIDENIEIKKGCGSDLMSDVLAFSHEKTLLLTGLTNPQVIRTAEIMGIKVIIFTRGKSPQKETINLAQEMNIALYISYKSQFESCGILYKNGINPEKIRKID